MGNRGLNIAVGLLGLAVVVAAKPAQALVSKCTAIELKAAGKEAYKKANCHSKAAKKTGTVDPFCLSKEEAKLQAAFTKAAAKGDCLNSSDAGDAEALVTSFINSLTAALVDGTPVPSKCTGAQLKAAGKKAYKKSICHSKAAKKDIPVDGFCLSKEDTKHAAAFTTATNKGDCQTAATEPSVEAIADGFISNVVSLLTATVKLSFTTTLGTANCGPAGLTSNPAAPFGGEIDSDTAGTTKIHDLGLGCLYFGGGSATVVPPGKIPDAATTFLAVAGSTLGPDAGTGPANCSQGTGPAKHCVNNNATPGCTGDGDCGGMAGSCALDANCYFGPPLPILSPAPFGALTTCVQNVIQTDASGTVNATTGASTVSLPLSSRVYITGNTTSPCPKCSGGTCTYGKTPGGACTVAGTLQTSIDCQPSLTGFQAPLPVNLTPLTSGAAQKTNASGNFCPGQNTAGAFGQPSAQRILETGSPAGDLTDGNPHVSRLASVFCVPATGNAAVDGVADIPGPGAINLNGNAQLQ